MKVLSVVGARPQFIKLAAVADALAPTEHRHVIVHTGQHYDTAMSDVFFSDLAIPAPDVNLGIGSGSHGVQTGAMLGALDGVLDEHRPDWVLVYGDTNSTLAGAVAAVKIHLPLAHLEAGLRAFNRRMPEEHNRVLTDHAADLCLAPTPAAMEHLGREGLSARARLVGDVMADVCLRARDEVRRTSRTVPGLPEGAFVLATVHRAENTDDPERLRAVVEALAAVPVPVLLLAHPRLREAARRAGVDLASGSIHVGDPLPYPDTVAAVLGARGVVTDSGGLQKEAFLLERPCTTVLTETEWAETLENGWNVLDPDLDGVPELAARPAPPTPPSPAFGRGSAAAEVVATLEREAPGE